MYTIRPWLYIGKFRETQDEKLLHHIGIGALLQLADSMNLPNIPSLYIPIEDGEPLPFDRLKKGVEFVRLEKAQDRNVLIACGAGISRSVSVAVAVLKEEENREHVTFASPHPLTPSPNAREKGNRKSCPPLPSLGEGLGVRAKD